MTDGGSLVDCAPAVDEHLYEREGFGRNTGRAPAKIPPGEIAPTELYFYADDLAAALSL